MKGVDLSSQYGFGWLGSLAEALQTLVMPAMGIASAAVLIYFLVGAVQFITSAGNKDKISGARNMITHAFIGLLLLVVAFILLEYVPQLLGVKISFFR